MIDLDFTHAVSLYVLVCLAIIFVIWLFHKKERDKDLFLEERFIWFCSVCTYTYVNTKEEKISICPRCGSYNKK